VQRDAAELGCLDEVLHSRTIVERGTSAHRQLAIYEEALDGGASESDALVAVVDYLIEATLRGV